MFFIRKVQTWNVGRSLPLCIMAIDIFEVKNSYMATGWSVFISHAQYMECSSLATKGTTTILKY